MNEDKMLSQSPDLAKTCQKMVFLYNALGEGWTVRKLSEDRYEFTKKTEEIKKEVNLNDFLRKFVQYNLNINNI